MGFLKLRAYIKTISRLPSKKAMRYYFEERTNKMFVGRRTTIVTRIKEDIKKNEEKQQQQQQQQNKWKWHRIPKKQKALAKSCWTSSQLGLFLIAKYETYFTMNWRRRSKEEHNNLYVVTFVTLLVYEFVPLPFITILLHILNCNIHES